MPTRPKKPCGHPNCPNLIKPGQRYCERHKDKDPKRFYDSASWQKYRKYKLSINPLCEECQREGRTTLATLVHHKVPIMDGGEVLPLISELESLCLVCHNKRHGPPY